MRAETRFITFQPVASDKQANPRDKQACDSQISLLTLGFSLHFIGYVNNNSNFPYEKKNSKRNTKEKEKTTPGKI